MKVYVKGTRQEVDLSQKDYVAGGGEGEVYVKGSVAYKIYKDAAKMIPLGKVNELSAIADPAVIRPENVLVDSRGRAVGYTMRFIKQAWTLCQLFPRVFRERNKVTEHMVFELVRKLQESVEHVHQAQVLIVDMNEMNFLVSKKFDEIYFIDADSYQTKHFPATALMPSVRDWKTKLGDFTENSDWFSFGIVSFQMFVGIHPYKGKHPKIHGFEDRMKAGVSVFNKDVSVPAVAYPLSTIPKEYKNWYESVFEKGERCPPPSKFGVVVVAPPVIKVLVGSAALDIEELGDYDGQVIRVCGDSKNMIVVTDKSVWLNKRRLASFTHQVLGIGFSEKGHVPIAIVDSDTDIPELRNLVTGYPLNWQMATTKVESYDGRVYCILLDKVYEVVLTSAGNYVIASTRESAHVLEHATNLYPGVAIQRLLGATYVSIFSEAQTTHQMPIKRLDGYKIIDAKFDHGVLMVIGASPSGTYDRFVFRFDENYSYDARMISGVTPAGLNFVTLDSGVCVCINEDDQLELFSARKDSTQMKLIKDAAISGEMTIGECRDCVVVAHKNKVYKVSMRSTKP